MQGLAVLLALHRRQHRRVLGSSVAVARVAVGIVEASVWGLFPLHQTRPCNREAASQRRPVVVPPLVASESSFRRSARLTA